MHIYMQMPNTNNLLKSILGVIIMHIGGKQLGELFTPIVADYN